jgi:beta-lactamase class A
VLAVFLGGAGIGVLIIALSHHSSVGPPSVKRLVTTVPAKPVVSAPIRNHRSRHSAASGPSAFASTVRPGAASSFATLEARSPGPIGIAVAPLGDGPVRTFGSLQIGHAWSTMKVPVLATLLRDYESSGQRLTSQGHGDAALAVEQSDNSAAEALFGQLEQIHGGLDAASAAVEQTLRLAGDPSTTINTQPNNQGYTTWGQSEWSATGEVLFYRALAQGCLLGPHDTAYVLELMRNVIPSQRWGAGAAGYPSTVSLGFKAGWGPEGGGYLVRQTAIVGSGNRGYVVSYIAQPPAGSFDQGVSTITSIARWAEQNVDLAARRPSAQCRSQP